MHPVGGGVGISEQSLAVRLREAYAALQSVKDDLHKTYATAEALLTEASDRSERGAINALIWECAAFSEMRAPYFSQYGQDAFIDAHIFNGKRDGTFVELGGYDGITGSNTLFFEMMRGWRGLLIEPIEAQLNYAASFRQCHCVNALVGRDNGTAEFVEITAGPLQMSGLTETYNESRRAWVEAQPSQSMQTVKRETLRLDQLLSTHHLSTIDYISLDVEGAELMILETFPFDDFLVRCWVIEAAHHREALDRLMKNRGYEWIESIGDDDIFCLT